MRVVLDTNVIVSGLISPGGPPGRILHAWEQGDFHLLVSPTLLIEYRRALAYDRVQERHLKNDEQLNEHVRNYAKFGILVDPMVTISIIVDDPDDNRVLECAEAGSATHIVTGDQHLLEIGAYQGATILTPRAFLDLLVAE